MSLHVVHPVDDDEAVSDSTTSTGSKLSRGSGFSTKRISLTRELQNLRRQMNKRMRCESDLRFTQMEALGRCLEEERVVHVLKCEEQDDRIAELESFQKQLGLEQKAHSELIDSDTLKIKELTARVNSLSRRGEVRDNEMIRLTQRFKETSAEYRKICQNNNERCSQFEELMQRFELQIAETNAKLIEFEAEHAFRTRKIEGQDDRIAELESFQKQLGLAQRAQGDQIHSELALNTREIEELVAQIDSLGRNGEVRDNELMELAQRCKETSAAFNVEFEDNHKRRAEDRSICQNNNERCIQLEELMRCFEAQIVETNAKLSEVESKGAMHTRKIEGQDDCVADLESQMLFDLEQKAQSEQIESEQASCTRQLEGLRAELNVKFEESHMWHTEVLKICPKNHEWCSQVEELAQPLETKILEHELKFHQHSELDHTRAAPVNFAFRDQFESQCASERKMCQELIEAGIKSLPTWFQDLTAKFNGHKK